MFLQKRERYWNKRSRLENQHEENSQDRDERASQDDIYNVYQAYTATIQSCSKEIVLQDEADVNEIILFIYLFILYLFDFF